MYQYGSKSRQYKFPVTGNNLTQVDKCLFVYLWKHDPNHPKSRSKGANDRIWQDSVP